MKTGVLTILRALGLAAVIATAASARETVFKDDRTLGAPNAPVVVIEYLAPSCPHCARFAATEFPEIKRNYIDTGKVLYVLRVFPLSAVDGAVAGLAKCQQPERYFAFFDLAFKKQAMWDPDGYVIPDVKAALVQLGGLAGLTPEAVTRCMEDKDEIERVNRIAQDGIDRYHIEAVPSLVIDGKVLLGETEASWPALKTRIDGLLAEAVAPPTPHKIVVHQHGHHKQGHHRHHRHHRHHIKGHANTKPAPKIVKANKAKTN